MSNNIYPLPADELAALYEINTQELILSAKGKSQPMTSDVKFVRTPWMGGLKFELEGRVLAVMGPPEPYEISLRFKMPPPTVADVIIVYAGYPQGKPVPIHFTGFVSPNNDTNSQQIFKEITAEPPKPPQTLTDDNQHISVINGHSFTIKYASEVPRFGSIKMGFDNKYLQLESAGIQDKDIVWTFKGLQPTPDTQVTILVFGGIAQYLIKKVYNVLVGLASESAVKLSDNGYIPRFLQRASEGESKITSSYPDAELHGVLASAPHGLGVSHPEELSNMTVTCKLKNGNLATVGAIGYTRFGPVIVKPGPVDDLKPLPPASSIPMEADKADSLMKAQGWKALYNGLSLTFSILPGVDREPCYTFDMAYGLTLDTVTPTQVRVGVNTGNVTPIGLLNSPDVASSGH
ncbi:hypothetical protein N7G274_002868 [Stereocaulon virgatum]|uniref:Uncharacterized protein n=1 Tax=Stereocaulon virgatum TaxID=373712 RepID=A0ABR4AGF3_9LECA